MITVNLTADLTRVQQMLTSLQQDQIPFATAYALTETAKAAQKEVTKEMGRVFDRPTKFTLNSTWIKAAKKKDFGTANFYAEVKIQDTVKDSSTKPVQWLAAEIRGGPRKLKGVEVLLRAKGLLPSGMYMVPTKFAPLDGYGNVSGGQINMILSQLQARNEYNLDKNETAKAKKQRNSQRYRGKRVLTRYFAVVPGQARTAHLAPGIWERINAGNFVGPLQRANGSIRPIFLYVPQAPSYSKRLDFDRIVMQTAYSQIAMQFKKALIVAMRTAGKSGLGSKAERKADFGSRAGGLFARSARG